MTSGGTPTFNVLDPELIADASRRRRRRFGLTAFALLAALGAAMGVAFLGNTGTVTASVTKASSDFVYPVADEASLPAGANFVSSLEYTHAAAITSSESSSTIETATLPSWSPTANSSGSVTTAGDLALIDTHGASNGVSLSIYITNLAGLQESYSSFALPLNVYESACTKGSCSWSQASGVLSTTTYLTSTEGFLLLRLPAGKYYDVALDEGGSYFCTSTAGTLAPSFYFSAQPY